MCGVGNWEWIEKMAALAPGEPGFTSARSMLPFARNNFVFWLLAWPLVWLSGSELTAGAGVRSIILYSGSGPVVVPQWSGNRD